MLRLAALLRLSGYTVYEAPDAAQALTLLASALPLDALITDVEMPGELDGVALAEAVRRSRPHLPLVVASAADHAARVRALGALFLRKPYRPDSLLDYLERTLAP